MKIANVEIAPAVMNAACSVAKTPEDVAALAATKIGAIVVGSITVTPREGNPEPRWFVGDGYALNSFGMPNQGAEYYAKELPAMVKAAHDANKKLILSVAGFNSDDYAQLASIGDTAGVDIIELNLGCPNVSVDGKQKPIASFDTDYIREIVLAVRAKTKLPLIVKLSPYSNPAELARVAQTLIDLDTISGVVTSNTFPNSYMVSDETPVLASKFGGLSGPAILPFVLGQVRQFRDLLPESIAVIGTGGIESTEDAKLFHAAGADATQAATLIVRDGHAAIDRIVV